MLDFLKNLFTLTPPKPAIYWPPANNRASGVDVSYWQDDNYTPEQINWQTLASKASFAFIRAGGYSLIDTDFTYNWQHSKSAGIPRGAYWYLTSDAPAKSAALKFVSACQGDFGELPLVADYEWQSWSSAGTARLYLKDFLLEVERLTGRMPMIYTSASRWATWGSSDVYWMRYELWVANYNVATPVIPKPWSSWLFWQYGTPTIVPAEWGVESKEIDANYFNGTLAQFNQRFGVNNIPEPEPVPETPPALTLVSISPVPSVKTTILIDVQDWQGDKLPYVLTFTPTVTPPPPVTPPPATTDLYLVDATKWSSMHDGLSVPPGQGPLTQYLSRIPKKGDNRLTLNKIWQDYIAKWNTAQEYGKIISPAFGPTFGINDKGMLVYLGLVYPGDNIVKVKSIVSGLDGLAWAYIDTIPLDTIPDSTKINPTATPWLFHIVRGAGTPKQWADIGHCTIPLLGEPWYVPLAALTKVK
jgi:GH25 family lysozyme M1 (1,4-beta-N-acetylmuramidase)